MKNKWGTLSRQSRAQKYLKETKLLVFMGTLAFFCLIIFSKSALANEISGNVVFYDDAKVNIKAYPHTIHYSGDKITINLTSKVFSGNINVGLGVNTNGLEFTDAYFNGRSIKKRFDYIDYNYQNMNRWYYTKQVSIVEDTEYSFEVESKINDANFDTKYWVCFWKSSDTIHDAVINNRIYCLDPWANVTFPFRQRINLSVASGTTNANYQVRLDLNSSVVGADYNFTSECVANETKTVFYDQNETILLDHWVEECDSSSMTVWVEYNDNVTTSIKPMFMYYGNDAQTPTSNGTNTFLMFDDFPGSSLNTDIWNIDGGAPTVSGGFLTLTTAFIFTDQNYTFKKYRTHLKTTANGNNGFLGFTNVGFDSIIASYAFRTSLELWGSTANAGQTTTVLANVLNIFRKYEIKWSNTLGVFLVDDNLNASHVTDVPASGIPAFLRSLAGNTVTVDWVFVGEQHGVEPSIFYGAEEALSQQLPVITFVAPTLVDQLTLQDYAYINVSIDEVALNCTLEFDGVNETMNNQSSFDYFINKTSLLNANHTFAVYCFNALNTQGKSPDAWVETFGSAVPTVIEGNVTIIFNADNPLPLKEELCLGDDLVRIRERESCDSSGGCVTLNQTDVLNCVYGCSDWTFSTFGGVGCIESDFTFAIFFIIGVFIMVLIIRKAN